MSVYITIDGGTTSTRVGLVKDGVVCDRIKLDIGVRIGGTDRAAYVGAIKNAIDTLVSQTKPDQIERILASGMITSESGLCDLPHIPVPAGIKELHETMFETTIKELSDIPVVFVRGVKTGETVADFDMMRGEETELVGLMDGRHEDCIYVLPGSHSKVIRTDENGRILSFSTMLSGEMVYALSQSTILKDSVDLQVSSLDKTYLLKGFELSQREGINKALFKVRTLKNHFDRTKEELYSFFVGVVLCDEVLSILKDPAKTVVLGGKKQLKEALALLLSEKTDKTVVELDEQTVDCSTSVGLVKIYEWK